MLAAFCRGISSVKPDRPRRTAADGDRLATVNVAHEYVVADPGRPPAGAASSMPPHSLGGRFPRPATWRRGSALHTIESATARLAEERRFKFALGPAAPNPCARACALAPLSGGYSGHNVSVLL